MAHRTASGGSHPGAGGGGLAALRAPPFYLLLTGLVTLAAGCGKLEDGDKTAVAKATDAPAQELWGTTIRLTDAGRPVAEVQAGHIRKYTERGITEIDSGLVVEFYDREGLHNSTLTAYTGTIREADRSLVARGNVVLVTGDSLKLETDELHWEDTSGKLLAPGHVRLHTRTAVEEGFGFEGDPDLKRWSLREVRGVASRGGGRSLAP